MNKILLHLRNQYKIFIFTGLCFIFLISVSAALSSVPKLSEQARSADGFVDSMGVAIHPSYTDTIYGKYDEIIKPRLQELGVRHVRNDSVALEDKNTQQKYLDLAKIGIKSTVIIDPRFPNQNTGSGGVDFVKSILESVEAVEGPNEPDDYKFGENFAQMIRDFQADLYFGIKKDPETANLPVLSPSAFFIKYAFELGQIPCDIGNTHHYPRGQWGIPADGLDRQILAAKVMCGEKPIIVTESGYNNGANLKLTEFSVSEQAGAKYLLRLFLEYFNRGIKRFYTYELIDAQPDLQGENYFEWHFGLLRNDGSPKPDFIALKNLISLLQDREAMADNSLFLKSLDYNLQGNTTNIHHTLLQKSNGNFYLILWQEVPSFEHKTKTDIVVPERSLILTLNTPISKATTYQPVNSITPLEKYDNNIKHLKLKVPDHPLVIELVPTL
ncbi:MAG: hypothetical protein ACRC80_25185 [Waterburya sp.]